MSGNIGHVAVTGTGSAGSRSGAKPEPEYRVFHARSGSRAHLDDSQEAGGAALIAASRAETGPAQPISWWLYALAPTPLGQACLWDAAGRVGVYGDWCLGGRIEGAHDSGTGLARAVLADG